MGRPPADWMGRVPGLLEERAAEAAWAGAVDGMQPAAACRPATVEEVVEIVTLAREADLAVLPVGGGTALHLGNPPTRLDLAVLLDGLANGLDHSPADMVATVPAGVTVGAVNAQLEAAGQRLPLDPPLPDQATVGGTLAAVPVGPRMAALGRPRDSVLGLQVVLPDGTLTRTGGRVVKNVTGYDLTKLHVGSLGTLGILVEATLKLQPLPEEQVTLAFAFPNLDGALRTASGILAAGLDPSALVAVNAPVGAALSIDVQPAGLIVEFAGNPATVARQEGATVSLAEQREAQASRSLRGTAARDLWAEVGAFPSATWPLAFRAVVPPGQVDSLLDAAPDVFFSSGLGGGLLAHYSLGTAFVGVEEAPSVGDAVGVYAELTALTASLGGHLVIETAPVEVKREVDVWGPGPVPLELFARVKGAFDDAGTLNPGRFVGGL